MQSTDGVMPLTVVQDYAGVMTRSLPDLALLMQATAVGDPNDPLDDVADGHRPSDWASYLRPGALKGKTIGVPATAFDDPFGTTGTSDALRKQYARFVDAGATIKKISDPPAAPARTYTGDTYYEGWRQWIKAHPDNPYTDPVQIMKSPLRLPQFRDTSPYTGTGAMSDAQLKSFEDYRAGYRKILADWMDRQGVDAVLYPA